MASLLSYHPYHRPLSPFSGQARALNPFFGRTHLRFLPWANPSSPFLLCKPFMARAGFSGPQFSDFESAEGFARELFGRLEGLIYIVADAAISSSDAAAAQGSKQSGDWLSGITSYLETVLKVLKNGLSALHVPYAYGFAIILLTVLVKAVTFPLTKKQVESALAMRSLQPQVKAIQQRYAGDQERIQLETARLYKLAGVNPLAGCLPTLVTIPVWIGLYRALSNVADEGLLVEGFFWIPSLSGPTTIAARQSGSGTSWLFPFVDGHPPLGWSDTFAYLVLPVLLVISQYISAQIMQPPQGNDPSQKSSQALTKFLPLMIGYFALSVPSGLSLYWFTNNILSTAQQIWLQKLGGAQNPVKEYIERISREEPSDIQKSISNFQKSALDIENEKGKATQEEKIDGLHRGERFKQIKEQEAARRKQRQEEKRKTRELAEASQTVNEQQNLELTSIEKRDEQDSMKDRTETLLSSTHKRGINCDASSLRTHDGSLHVKLKEDEAAEVHASNGTQTTDDALDRRDRQTE